MWGKGTSRLGNNSLTCTHTDTLAPRFPPVIQPPHTLIHSSRHVHTHAGLLILLTEPMLWTQAEWQGLGGGEVNTSSHIYNCLSISEATSLHPSLRNGWLSVHTPLQLHSHSITCTLTSELPSTTTACCWWSLSSSAVGLATWSGQ